MPRRRTPVDFQAVKDIGVKLPDVVDSSTARGSALKVLGRLMACEAIHKSAEPNTLMVRISIDDRTQLIAEHPETYYVTEHYRKHPAVLVRLSYISRRSLEELLGRSWRFVFEEAGAGKRV